MHGRQCKTPEQCIINRAAFERFPGQRTHSIIASIMQSHLSHPLPLFAVAGSREEKILPLRCAKQKHTHWKMLQMKRIKESSTKKLIVMSVRRVGGVRWKMPLRSG